jgi:cytochrome c peroxidase
MAEGHPVNWKSPALPLATLGVAIVALAAATPRHAEEWHWVLPPGFPEPVVPPDNPMSAAKVELGRHLFYDKRLSGNQTFSCASCHEQQHGFNQTLERAKGSTGEIHPRASMSLGNIAYSPVLTWANPNMKTLEAQALVPMFGETPVELGLSGMEAELLTRIRNEPRYQTLFPLAFPGARELFTLDQVTKAIAAFERTLITGDSPFDRAQHGDSNAMTAAARRGQELFYSETTECFHCHGGFNFTGTENHVGKGIVEIEYHNTGLYNLGGKGAYPAPNIGMMEHTGRPEDMGRFKAPSLRNIAVTAPYMHDGSVPTLEAALDHYAAGGRTISAGPNRGVGADNPYKSELVSGFTITPDQRADLVEFLRSLTDSAFLTNPRFADPWKITEWKYPAPSGRR